MPIKSKNDSSDCYIYMKDIKNKRTEVVKIYLTKEEKELLKFIAHRNKISASTYVQTLIFN